MTLILLLLLASVPSDTLRIGDCYRDAEAAHPRSGEFALRDEAAQQTLDNLTASLLPRVSIGGQAVYHSDVPSIPIQIPGTSMPAASHDQYRIGLSLEQTLYDAGSRADRSLLEKATRDAAKVEIRVELHALRAQVDDAFFGVLLAEATLGSIQALRRDLGRQVETLEARVHHGIAPPSAVDVLRVELIRLEQQELEFTARRRSGLHALGELIGRRLGDETILALSPSDPAEARERSRQRPEFAAFDRRREVLDARSTQLKGEKLPRLSGFVELAYGQPPGLDLFADRFDVFYQLGVRLVWRPWDWGVVSRSRRSVELERNILDLQEDVFERAVRIAADGQTREIDRLRAQLALDDSIAVLRRRISEQASSQLENGVITATDYLTERNAEEQALLSRARHRVELARAAARLAYIVGQK